jgi:hypothetical protein
MRAARLVAAAGVSAAGQVWCWLQKVHQNSVPLIHAVSPAVMEMTAYFVVVAV